MRVIFSLVIFYVLLNSSCSSMENLQDPEIRKSLERVYRACGYSAEDARTPSTHPIVVVEEGFYTEHEDLKNVFINPWDPIGSSKNIDQILHPERCVHGTSVSGIIHDLTPTAKIIPILRDTEAHRKKLAFFDSVGCKLEREILPTILNYSLNKTQGKIINLSQNLSEAAGFTTPISQNVKDVLMKAFSEDKIIVVAAGNACLPMDSISNARDLGELAELSNHKLILVGATVYSSKHEKEQLWVDGQFPLLNIDRDYITSIMDTTTPEKKDTYLKLLSDKEFLLGSIHPGEKDAYQNIFITAPTNHYAPYANFPAPHICYKPSKNARRYSGMTSCAAPVVTSFVERLWTHYPNATAEEIGLSIYHGANKDVVDYVRNFYGEGLVNYRNSLELLKDIKRY